MAHQLYGFLWMGATLGWVGRNVHRFGSAVDDREQHLTVVRSLCHPKVETLCRRVTRRGCRAQTLSDSQSTARSSSVRPIAEQLAREPSRRWYPQWWASPEPLAAEDAEHPLRLPARAPAGVGCEVRHSSTSEVPPPGFRTRPRRESGVPTTWEPQDARSRVCLDASHGLRRARRLRVSGRRSPWPDRDESMIHAARQPPLPAPQVKTQVVTVPQVAACGHGVRRHLGTASSAAHLAGTSEGRASPLRDSRLPPV